MSKRHESGRGTVGCLFGIIIAIYAVVAAIRVVPVKTKVMELKKFAETQAEQASLPHHGDQYVVDQIFTKARLLQLPLLKENIRARRDMGTMYVDYKLDLQLKLPLYTYNWHIEEHIERPLF